MRLIFCFTKQYFPQLPLLTIRTWEKECEGVKPDTPLHVSQWEWRNHDTPTIIDRVRIKPRHIWPVLRNIIWLLRQPQLSLSLNPPPPPPPRRWRDMFWSVASLLSVWFCRIRNSRGTKVLICVKSSRYRMSEMSTRKVRGLFSLNVKG